MIGYSQLNNTYELNNQDSMHRGENDDSTDRIMKHLKNITFENDKLEKKILQLQNNPKSYINPLKNKLFQKVQQLHNQNAKLKRVVQKSKLPAYSQIKRRSIAPQQILQNLNNHSDSLRNSLNQSLRNSNTLRSALSQINSSGNFDKNENASTCFNEEQRYMTEMKINPILKLQKPSKSQQQQRQRLTDQIRYLIAKTQIFEETIEKLKINQDKNVQQMGRNRQHQEPAIIQIQEYKNKLLRLLNKLKSREIEMDEMVKVYKQMHEQTIKKLQESTEMLRLLQQKQVDKDVERKYAEVLELEEKLKIINAELQEMDEEKWLQKVLRQLSIVCKRLNVPMPKCETVREAIDELCESLIEGHLMIKNDVNSRLTQLKQYQQQQRHNNHRLVQALKLKQQGLGKKLTNLQIQKQSSEKK